MGKGAEEWRAETKRRQHAQEENDVSRFSKEDCCRSTSEMGEVEGCRKEVGVRHVACSFREGRSRRMCCRERLSF
jgi:hypothetical protein